ncbi:autotransporter outer membrane beta-barrel domain-containing protein [Paralcaligenes ureilyticus]|uniref:Autotransporter-associated beta strand protein n=1 Tax=Paralcaligenes ureilyticus TaxID=627131 RepID=A0A4R3M136_9BURK|nr:autotransporter outer membrane beta-barrel domain-containing protein [Paralcaligenes ureilyticus]TCT04805.1 autotransporter-associated beta strand protein [Paralcaligenes ureilyticus]
MILRTPRQHPNFATLFAALVVALSIPYSPARAQSWMPVGPSPTIMATPGGASTNVVGIGNNPVAGAMQAVLPSPTHPNMLFASAVNGGVWQTVDGGATWKPLGDDLPSLSIGAMSFDQSDPSYLWVGFGKQSSYNVSGASTGIVRFDTTTGAWSPPLGNDLMGKDISRIIANGNQIVVGIKTSPNDPGVWRSADGGATFTNASTGLPAGNITSLVNDPNNANRYYAAVVAGKDSAGIYQDPKGVYRSDDGGASWTWLSALPILKPASANMPLTQDIMLSIARDGTVVASVISPVSTPSGLLKENPPVTVYRSSNQGQSWTSMGSVGTTEYLPDGTTVQWGIYTSGQFGLHGALLVDPNDSTVVYLSGDAQGPGALVGDGLPTSIGARTYSGRLFRGKFNPATGQTVWEAITDDYTANGSGPHADSRFMMIDAAGNLLQTDDGGIYRRTDPTSRYGIWQSLNGNLQTGEIHDAAWNALSHTTVAAMQDNGSTIQLRAGNPTYAVVAGGDGGIAAVNSNWQLNGQRYAANYISSQHLGGPTRIRTDAANEGIAATTLDLGIEQNGQFLRFGDGTGQIDPPRPKKPVTKGQAAAAQTQTGIEVIPFYPSFVLNRVDPTRFAIGGYDLYAGQDPMVEDSQNPVRIVTQKLTNTGPTNLGFISLAYGAHNNADALLGGTGYRNDLAVNGDLYYTPDVNTTVPTSIYSSTGIQAALFDRSLGTGRVYASDGTHILRGAPTSNTAYAFTDISGNLPAGFNERRGLDHIDYNGVSALVAAGTHNVAGGNWLYTLRGPADATSFIWDTRLGKIPNSQVFGLDYSTEDDVLLAYTMGRGAFALADVTTYFPEATQLIFGQAGFDSLPVNAQLTDGQTLDGHAFGRPLIKRGAGTLSLAGATATYSGGTSLNGGLTLVDSDANLGVGGSGLSFDSGTLRFLAPFSLNRPINLMAGGGALDTGRLAVAQGSQPIGGTGQLTITGGGLYTLTTDNSYTGGTFISGATLAASKDSQLGAAGGGIGFDAGRLNLQDNFALNPSGTFNRPLTVYLGGGTLDTGNNDIPFAGSINGSGALTFLGHPLQIAGDLHMNAIWNGPMNVPASITLRGTGLINGPLTVRGRLYPGNSPGTMTVNGPVTQMPGSSFAVDIDGTGTANGPGNYSRLVVNGLANTYTANGQITPILRGITGAASNIYTPALGQGFTVVQAAGGVSGSYSGLTQPASGLLPGSRFDTVYGSQAVQLYVTPASYTGLDVLGIPTNANRQRVGGALERIRPAAGVRAPGGSQALFDALSPVGATQLAPTLDQLSGVSHAQLLWSDMNNSKMLTRQLMDLVGTSRRDERGVQTRAIDGKSDSSAWAYVLQRNSHQKDDSLGYGYDDTANGIMVGFERRLAPGAVAGISLGYADSRPTVTQGMGSGSLQNWQLMAYGSRERDGWFVEGAAGFGIGQISARRNVNLPGIGGVYRADLRSRNLTLEGQTGWRLEGDGPRLEASLGLQYLASRHLAASENGAASAAVLGISAGTLQSLAPSAGLAGSIPFKTAAMDWRASLRARVSHELLDKRPTLNTTLLGTSMDIKGAAVGRTTVTVGLGLSGQINQRVSVYADVAQETAGHWRATTASMGLRIMW